MRDRILVLKLGALGNMVLSLSSFAAIRQHHRDADITLLTTAPYAAWMAASPYFDRVLVDERPSWWELRKVLRLRHLLMSGRFRRVYDLQTSNRSSWYLRLFPRTGQPEWSGIAHGCSHPDRNPDRDRVHDIDRQHSQLRQAGIAVFPPVDLSWTNGNIARFNLPPRFVLFVPGSSPHRPIKRWPAHNYRTIAGKIAGRGVTPVVLGSTAERTLVEAICLGTRAINLAGETTLHDLAPLASAAAWAIGNDTGPMHLIALAGCLSLVLFSTDSDPARCAPRGLDVRVLRRPDLAALTPDEVLNALPRPVTEDAS